MRGETLDRRMPLQNLLTIWSTLDARRRIIIVGATVAMFAAVLSLSRMANSPSMALLYAGLDQAAAGGVVAALDQRGVPYEIRGDSIHVDQSLRDSLRMTLAAEGLPANGGVGYELLDSLSGFGTTSQMFDAAYWRAKEGELARTILASPQIRSARVHIAQAPSQPFQRDQTPTASVTVATANGGLQSAQAAALRHLVAAAVAGMRPDDVSVIDTVAGLIPPDTDAGFLGTTGDTRAAEIKHNVERLLAARVGPGKAVVEVSVDVETKSEQVTERTFDPQGRVAISQETEERSDSASQPGGDITVASNLPEGDAASGGDGNSQSTESRERVNYEVSETQREIIRAPGAMKKLSVAVLIDGQIVAAEDGSTTWQARPESELAVLRELVASAVGLDESRGDVLTLRSLQFEPLPEAGVLAETGLLAGLGPLNLMSAIQIGVLAAVALILGLFVLRPVLLSTLSNPLALQRPGAALALPTYTETERGRADENGQRQNRALPVDGEGNRILTGEIDDGLSIPSMSVINFDEQAAQADPVARLRRMIDERQAESVEILRGWMEAEEERT